MLQREWGVKGSSGLGASKDRKPQKRPLRKPETKVCRPAARTRITAAVVTEQKAYGVVSFTLLRSTGTTGPEGGFVTAQKVVLDSLTLTVGAVAPHISGLCLPYVATQQTCGFASKPQARRSQSRISRAWQACLRTSSRPAIASACELAEFCFAADRTLRQLSRMAVQTTWMRSLATSGKSKPGNRHPA